MITMDRAAHALFLYDESMESVESSKQGTLKLNSYRQWSIGEISRRFYEEAIKDPYIEDRLSAVDIVEGFISDLEFFVSISTRNDNKLLFSTAKNAAEGFLKYVLHYERKFK